MRPKRSPSAKTRNSIGPTNLSSAEIAKRLRQLTESYLHRFTALWREFAIRASYAQSLSGAETRARRDELRAELDLIPIELAWEAIKLLKRHSAHAHHILALRRAQKDRNIESVVYEVMRVSRNVAENATDARKTKIATPKQKKKRVARANVVIDEKLKQLIHQAVKAAHEAALTDGVFLAAYRQCGTLRKAAEFLSGECGQKISKDKVARAVKRNGGASAVLRTQDSESIQRTVASQRRDKLEKHASPRKPHEIE